MHAFRGRRKKKKENPPNQPTSHHSNKYKNISWQIHPFHCRTKDQAHRPPTAQASPAAERNLSPPLLLSAALSPVPSGCLPEGGQGGSSRSEATFCSSAGTYQTSAGKTPCQTMQVKSMNRQVRGKKKKVRGAGLLLLTGEKQRHYPSRVFTEQKARVWRQY